MSDRWCDQVDIAPKEEKCAFSLAVFYNLHLDCAECLRRSGSHSLGAKLQLSYADWPRALLDLQLVSLCTSGVSKDVQIKSSDKVADVLSVTFALVEHPRTELPTDVVFCAGKKELKYYNPSSVSFLSMPLTRKAFGALPTLGKVGLHQVLLQLNFDSRVLVLLKRMASAHGRRLFEATGSREVRKSKMFEHHMRWNAAFGKVVQRHLNRCKHGSVVPLQQCPCQLGFSDAAEWAATQDVCGMASLKKAADLLSCACNCGRISFKQHKHRAKGLGYAIDPKDWIGVNLHNCKDRIIHRFLNGKMVDVFHGELVADSVLAADGENAKKTFRSSKPLACQNVQNHIAFLVEVQSLQRLVDDEEEFQCFDVESTLKSSASGMAFMQRIPLRRLVELGEFHFLGSWQNEERSAFGLSRESHLSGDCCIILGEYVGDLIMAIDAMIQAREKEATPAMRTLLSLHSSATPDVEDASIFASITSEDVQKELSTVGIELTEDQRQYITVAAKQPFCRAGPGAGKSTVGGGFVKAYVAKQMQEKCERALCVWLTRTRAQRDVAQKSLRGLWEDPLCVWAIGRPVDAAPSDDCDFCLDALLEAEVTKLLGDLVVELAATKQLLEEYATKATLTAKEWAEQRDAARNYIILQARKERRVEAILQEKLQSCVMICLTVDAFNQMLSGASPLSDFFADYVFGLAIGDELHQVESEKLFAITCGVQHLLGFFDQAQGIAASNVGDVYAKVCSQGDELDFQNLYQWDHERRDGKEVEHLWDWVDPEKIASLAIIWRFGGPAMNLVRACSSIYGSGSTRLVNANELANFQATSGLRVPYTKVRAVLYYNALVHPSLPHGRLSNLALRIGEQAAGYDEHLRIGAVVPVFLTLIHEGLCLLSLLSRNELPHVSIKDIPIGTYLYGKHCINTLILLVKFVLEDREICGLYQLSAGQYSIADWKVMTPEASSGITVILSQFTVVPRDTTGADLQGNLRDEGRFHVGMTRQKHYLSLHLMSECFQDTRVTHWMKLWRLLTSEVFEGDVHHVQTKDFASRNYVPSSAWFGGSPFSCTSNEHLNFTELLRVMTPLPEKLEEMKIVFPSGEPVQCSQQQSSVVEALYAQLQFANMEKQDVVPSELAHMSWIPASRRCLTLLSAEQFARFCNLALPVVALRSSQTTSQCSAFFISCEENAETTLLHFGQTVLFFWMSVESAWESAVLEDRYAICRTHSSLLVGKRATTGDPYDVVVCLQLRTGLRKQAPGTVQLVFSKLLWNSAADFLALLAHCCSARIDSVLVKHSMRNTKKISSEKLVEQRAGVEGALVSKAIRSLQWFSRRESKTNFFKSLSCDRVGKRIKIEHDLDDEV